MTASMIQNSIKQHFQQHIQLVHSVLEKHSLEVIAAGELLAQCLHQGGKILSCGNGGSAADAQHLVSELVGRFVTERKGLPAYALTANAMTVTAIANDYTYEHVFARQIQALAVKGDTLFAISTSGNSQNVVLAVQAALDRQMRIVVLTGSDGGALAPLLAAHTTSSASSPDRVLITVPSEETPRIQEAHILIIHCLCDTIDRLLFANAAWS